MTDVDPRLSDEYLDRNFSDGGAYSPPVPKGYYDDVPGGPPKDTEPKDRDELRAHRERKEAARSEYSGIIHDDLDEALDSNRAFLAKMYVIAKHFNQHDELKELLERAVKLRPDRVEAASEVVEALGHIYQKISETAGGLWETVHGNGHWEGEGADSFGIYLMTLVRHMHSQSDNVSLRALSNNTRKLMMKFARELRQWRSDFADTIKAVAEQDKEEMEALGGEYIGAVSDDPYHIGRELLDALIKTFDAVDKQKERHEKMLKKYSTMSHFGMGDFDRDEVGAHRVTVTEGWSGSLTEGT